MMTSRNTPGVTLRYTDRLSVEQLMIFSLWMSNSDPWRHCKYSTEECRTKLSNPRCAFLLASVDDEDVGFLAYLEDGDLGGPLIRYVATAPHRRSQGTGSALIKELLHHFAGKSIYLTVSESNVRARALYLKLGFSEIGAIPDYNLRGESEQILRYPGHPKRESAVTAE